MNKTNAERQRSYRERRLLGIPTRACIKRTDQEKKAIQAILQSNYQKRMRTSLKILVLSHYGNGVCECVNCGENRIACLSIDHKNGGGNKHRKNATEIKRLGFYGWLEKNNFPEGYQTLCMNCQWVKREENKEVRKRKVTPL